MIVTPGATSVRVRFTVLDGDGNPLTTATNSTLTLSYLRDGAASNTSISLSAGTVGTYSSGGVKHIARGVYELGIPDAAVAAGVREVELLGTDTNGQVIPRTITLLDLASIDANVDDVLADTNELQTDWADGGRLDAILDAAIKKGTSYRWTNNLSGAGFDDVTVDDVP